MKAAAVLTQIGDTKLELRAGADVIRQIVTV